MLNVLFNLVSPPPFPTPPLDFLVWNTIGWPGWVRLKKAKVRRYNYTTGPDSLFVETEAGKNKMIDLFL
jgi:hypothetical protein